MAEKYISQYTGLKIDEAIELALLLNSLRGGANGLATLDANKKLVQMPSAADVGAVPTTRTINGKTLSQNISLSASDVSALSTSTRSAANGVAGLDSNKRLIQMPTISEILSQTVIINNGTDFNTLKTPGVYAQPTIAQTSNNTNMPANVNTAFFLIILKENINQTINQIFLCYNGRAIYTRHWDGTTWTKWYRYLSELDYTFESGTTYTIESSQQMITGLVTESNKHFRFSIMLPKNNYNNLSAQILSLKCNIRGVEGNYLTSDKYVSGGTELVGNSAYTITPKYFDGQMLTILIEKASWGTVNNSPATIEVNHFSVKFT